MGKLTQQEVMERQGWSFYQKIDHSLGAIEQFLNAVDGKAYVSFSGGKDSTVLLDLVRRVRPETKAMFIKTGNDYPEIHKFALSFDNVDVVRPKMTFKQVVEKYGFPLVSKEQSQYINEAKHTQSDVLRDLRLTGAGGTRRGKVSSTWRHLVDAPFDVTHRCCTKLKKDPAKAYEKETGLHPILGTMAEESQLRLQKYMVTSCNVLEGHRIASYPLSIWREADIWRYIREFKLPYCELYDRGFDRTGCMACGFGCQHHNRFNDLYTTHKKAYLAFAKYENNGVSFSRALSYTLNKGFTELD
jgi:3'-phosphoadenosine 5'-phosphosulfate sulfotransferase (PAPS reductase)/FAD synthetase